MVRPGLSIHTVDLSEVVEAKLACVVRWRAVVTLLRLLAVGSGVSFSHQTPQDLPISVTIAPSHKLSSFEDPPKYCARIILNSSDIILFLSSCSRNHNIHTYYFKKAYNQECPCPCFCMVVVTLTYIKNIHWTVF